MGGTICLCHSGTRQIDSPERNLIPLRNVVVGSGILSGLVENEIWVLPYQLLDRRLDKLIKRVKLLGYKSLFCKKGGNDRPAVFRGDFFRILFVPIRVFRLVVYKPLVQTKENRAANDKIRARLHHQTYHPP